MKLFEHADFEQAIFQAAEHFRAQKLRPAIIEKDYYVTEALRVIAASAGDNVLFKGGSSLARDGTSSSVSRKISISFSTHSRSHHH